MKISKKVPINLEITLINAQISTAAKKLQENSNYEFRFRIIRINKEKGITETKLSKKVPLKESLMYFDDDKIVFTDIDYHNDKLEVYPLLGSMEKGKKYEPTIRELKDYNILKTHDELWILKNPTKSFVKLKLLINYGKNHMIPDRNHEDKFSQKSIDILKANDSDKKKLKSNENIGTAENQMEIPNNSNFFRKYSESNIKKNENAKILKKTSEKFAENMILKSHSINSPLNPVRASNQIFLDSKLNSISNNTNFESKHNSSISNQTLNDSLFFQTHDALEVLKAKNNTSKILQNPFTRTIQIQEKNQLKFLPYEEIPIGDKYSIQENLESKVLEKSVSNFCESFFTVSIPISNQKLMQENKRLSACCGHVQCEMFNSYKPEITKKFPDDEFSNVTLNNTIAHMCFPKGIKLCLSSKTPNPFENFLVVITNEQCVRYYIRTFHYYVKYSIEEFQKKFKINLTNDYLNLEKENRDLELYSNQQDLQKKISEKIEKKLKFVTDFYFSDFLYVPECMCLLSKYPYSDQMEKCLDSLYKLSILPDSDKNKDKEEISKFILHITKEVPVPPLDKKVQFYIPFNSVPLILKSPLYYDLPLINFSLKNLVEIFTAENIVFIHNLMLNEQKLLFVSDNISKNTEIIEGFTCLFYPLQWTYPYIPVLSEELLNYLQTPFPFIMGVDSELFEIGKEFLRDEDDVFVININKKTITKFQTKDRKLSKDQMYLNINQFPEENEKELVNFLKDLKKLTSDKKEQLNYDPIEKKIRKIFVRSMVRLFGNYTKYLSFLEDVPLFNKESFLINSSFKDKRFFDSFVDSQLFNFFLQQDVKRVFPYFAKISLRYSSSLIKINKFAEKRSNSLSNTIKNLKIQGKKQTPNKHNSVLGANNNNISVVRNNSFHPIHNSGRSEVSVDIEKDNENIDFDTFTIQPYFISESIFNSNIYRIEDYINMKFKDSPQLMDKGVYINEKEIDFKFNFLKFRRFYFQEENSPKFGTSIISHEKVDNIRISEKKAKNENSFIINDYLVQIFTSKTIVESQRKSLLLLLKFKESRRIFAKMIFQQKFLENKTHYLVERSFSDLSLLAITSLLEFREITEFSEARLITKSLFFYYKVVNKKQYFLYREVTKKVVNLPIWNLQIFWEKWFEHEKKETENKFTDEEGFNFNILISISKCMLDLKIDISFICDVIVDNISNKIFNDVSLSKELQIIIKKQHAHCF